MNFTEISMSSGRTFQSPIYPHLTHTFAFSVTAKNPRAEDFATLRAYVENAATQHMDDIVHDEQLDRDGGAVLQLLRSAEAEDPRDEDKISELKQSLDTFPQRRLPWVELTNQTQASPENL